MYHERTATWVGLAVETTCLGRTNRAGDKKRSTPGNMCDIFRSKGLHLANDVNFWLLKKEFFGIKKIGDRLVQEKESFF